ncbi:PepSY domain-containing protein [Algoriphagus sp. CAU 1675]|uniref:PepSY domain-containing protein n=1 Tax=Algoriphagus sp. CAU 1675 TaxID=3032597 RepID=UPI0023DA05C2|nr:PepSY domain-containing protein [Algoriphagus sp. CAU 1675]MDF2157642.1 PepSY domain-containing protein [Algoriphagus sp. CAU 1675]
MRKNNQYYVRKIHRFLGVFIGIQFLLWTISGLYFSWTDIDEIHGDHFHNEHMMHMTASNLVDPGSLDSTLEISSLELRFVLHQPHYWVNGKNLYNAQTAELKGEITEEEAKEIAKIYIKGNFGIKEAEYLTQAGPHHEYRGRPLPAWAIHYDHPENLVAYIDAKSGNFERVRHRSWRWFDFLWMFHTMDYAGRDDFNNLLLRAFSLFGLATVFSGFTLFFMSRKRKRKGLY